MKLEFCFLAVIAISVSAELLEPIPCVTDASCLGISTKAGVTGVNETVHPVNETIHLRFSRAVTVPSFCDKKLNPDYDFGSNQSASNPIFLFECACTEGWKITESGECTDTKAGWPTWRIVIAVLGGIISLISVIFCMCNGGKGTVVLCF